MDEALTGRRPKLGQPLTPLRHVLLLTDAKAVFDHLTSSKATAAGDRRVSVELSLLRQEMEEDMVCVRWLPTTMNLADSMTKLMASGDPPVEYLSRVLREGKWTLGPDPRAPEDRRKRSVVQEWHGKKVETMEEADFYTEELATFLASLREGDNEIYHPKARPVLRRRPRGRKRAAA